MFVNNVPLTTDICQYASKVAYFMTDFCRHDLPLNLMSISQSDEERVGMFITFMFIQKENRRCTHATSPTSYYCYQFLAVFNSSRNNNNSNVKTEEEEEYNNFSLSRASP